MSCSLHVERELVLNIRSKMWGGEGGGGNDDEDGSMWELYCAWCKEKFTRKKLAKLADETRKENARDLATQAAEMGYHNYSSDNGGTWYRD